MEKILDYYLRKNEDPEWVTKYSSLAKENDGKIFEYVNTNFRKLHSFENAFIEFSKNDDYKKIADEIKKAEKNLNTEITRRKTHIAKLKIKAKDKANMIFGDLYAKGNLK